MLQSVIRASRVGKPPSLLSWPRMISTVLVTVLILSTWIHAIETSSINTRKTVPGQISQQSTSSIVGVNPVSHTSPTTNPVSDSDLRLLQHLSSVLEQAMDRIFSALTTKGVDESDIHTETNQTLINLIHQASQSQHPRIVHFSQIVLPETTLNLPLTYRQRNRAYGYVIEHMEDLLVPNMAVNEYTDVKFEKKIAKRVDRIDSALQDIQGYLSSLPAHSGIEETPLAQDQRRPIDTALDQGLVLMDMIALHNHPSMEGKSNRLVYSDAALKVIRAWKTGDVKTVEQALLEFKQLATPLVQQYKQHASPGNRVQNSVGNPLGQHEARPPSVFHQKPQSIVSSGGNIRHPLR